MYKSLTQKNQHLCLDFEKVTEILVLKQYKSLTNKHKNAICLENLVITFQKRC